MEVSSETTASSTEEPPDVYVSQRGRARRLSTMFRVYVGITVMLMLTDCTLVAGWERAERTGVDAPVTEAMDVWVSIIAGVSMLAFWSTAIVFARFLMRANRNTPFIRLQIGWSPSSMVWWYFVPFANVVRPYQSFVELWRASVPSSRHPTAPPTGVVSWWALWVASNIGGALASRMIEHADESREIISGLQIDVVACIATIGASLVLRRLVLGLSALQDEAHAERIAVTLPG
jgi:uncharacterized protein DUF4328